MKFGLNLVSLLATIIALSIPVTAQAKERSEKSVSGINAPKAINIIADEKQKIAGCEDEYNRFRTASWAAEKAWDAAYDAAQASARLTGVPAENPDMSKVDPYHKMCAESAKQEFIPTAKIFIKSLKTPGAQKTAKDMVAQWITAIDAIGNEGAKAENAKFQTLANTLMLDL